MLISIKDTIIRANMYFFHIPFSMHSYNFTSTDNFINFEQVGYKGVLASSSRPLNY